MAYIKAYYGTSYIEELKSVAGVFGYCADDVEHLLEEGFSPEELEDYSTDANVKSVSLGFSR